MRLPQKRHAPQSQLNSCGSGCPWLVAVASPAVLMSAAGTLQLICSFGTAAGCAALLPWIRMRRVAPSTAMNTAGRHVVQVAELEGLFGGCGRTWRRCLCRRPPPTCTPCTSARSGSAWSSTNRSILLAGRKSKLACGFCRVTVRIPVLRLSYLPVAEHRQLQQGLQLRHFSLAGMTSCSAAHLRADCNLISCTACVRKSVSLVGR